MNTGSLRQTLAGHSASIRSLAISPVRGSSLAEIGQTLASGGLDNTVKIWQLPAGKESLTFPKQSSIVESVAISPDGQILAIGCWGNIVKLWNLKTGQEIRQLSESGGVSSPES